MAELQVSKRTIKEFLENKKADFLIPGYQRQYTWTEVECGTLWDDLFAFAMPNDDGSFDNDDEYFLGPVETFLNENRQMEVIDGQQRLISLMLLLRAFYNYEEMKDPQNSAMRSIIGRCLWKTDVSENLLTTLKINSESINDDDKKDFFYILNTGEIPAGEGKTKKKEESNYVKNYRFFQTKIGEFVRKTPTYFSYLPARILNNVIILPIEASSEESATDIFFILNNRGVQLSDSDIFKFKFYKYYSNQIDPSSSEEERKKFIDERFTNRWKKLEKTCEIFNGGTGNPVNELFIRYMYYERAIRGIKDVTTISLRMIL